MVKVKAICLALFFFGGIADGSVYFNNLRQNTQLQNQHQGNTQQNNPLKNQLLTNEESPRETSLKGQSIAYSDLGFQSHFQEAVQMKNHAKKTQSGKKDIQQYDLNIQKRVKQVPSLRRQSKEEPKNYDRYFNKFDRIENGMINHLRSYLTEYDTGDIGKYGFLFLMVIAMMVSVLTCQNMGKLKQRMQGMKDEYEKKDKARRKQIKLLMKTSEKKILLPQDEGSQVESNENEEIKS